jgi:chemotaxis protein MotB
MTRVLALIVLLAPLAARADFVSALDAEDPVRWQAEKKRAKYEQLLRDRIAELEKQLHITEANSTSTRAQLSSKAAELDKEREELAKVRALATESGRSIEDLKKKLEELKLQQQQAEARAQQFRDMVAKFKAMVDAGKLQVEIRDGIMLVKLPDNILFDPGKTALKPAGKEALAQVAQILSGIEGRRFQVTGHTDNVPIKSKKFRSNWELSTQRAVEVVNVMIDAGMDPKRLSAAGYADTLPIAANTDALGRLQNRRIEIVVQPKLEELPGIAQP